MRVLSHRAGIQRTRARALAVVLGLAAHAAGAETETEPIRIEYAAPEGCPDASEFSRRVFGRTSKARPAEGAEPARTFVVDIVSSESGIQGSLLVREENMSTMARRVTGKDCDEVARALSLAAALAIDPEAALTTPEPTGTAGAGAAAGTAGVSSTPEPPREDPRRRTDTPGETKKPPGHANDRRAAWLVGASTAFGPAPTPGLGASAGLEWSSPSPVLLPSALGVELVFLTSAEYDVAGAGSSFTFAFARPYVCTLGLAISSDVGVLPCIGGAFGAVFAEGSRIERPASETRFWAAGELALRLDVALSEDWLVDATGSLVLPFTRYRFVFRTPDTSIHDVPALTAAAGLRVGRRF